MTSPISKEGPGKWIIETNHGYVEGSIGAQGTDEIFPRFTDDVNKATYQSLEDAKEWAAQIISKTLCGVLYVKLIPLVEKRNKEK